MTKCPNCGAPIHGDACAYCGTAVQSPGSKARQSVDAALQQGRGRRSILDIILIALGAVWLVIVIAVAIELKYWRGAAEMAAVLMLASPALVLLLIGFRRKKPKLFSRKKEHIQHETGRRD